MKGPDTDALGTHTMAVEVTAHLTVAATLLSLGPYTPIVHPGEQAIHVVNQAMKDGNLGRLHHALTEHLR